MPYHYIHFRPQGRTSILLCLTCSFHAACYAAAVGRMMVEAHGGVIWVESKGEGLGSTFAFAIPLPDPPKPQAVAEYEEMLG